MNFKTLLLLFCLTLAGCGQDGPPAAGPLAAAPEPFGIEIIVRTPASLRRVEDVTALVEQAARHGVAVISLLVKQDEDGAIESGRVYYRSAIAPVAAGYEDFDVLQAMLTAAAPHKIRVRAWIPQFHDQVAAKRNAAWQMRALRDGTVQPYTGSRQTEYFVNPLHPEVQAYELSIIREIVGRYAVDGVMLDWIRFDNFDMDLGDVTRQAYRGLTGQDPVGIDFAHAGAERERWNEFRSDGLAAYVRSVRQAIGAQLPLGVYVLPPEFVEVGQDAAKFLPAADAIAPMCYFRDWKFPIEWFWSSCMADSARKTGSAQLVPALDANLTDEQYRQMFEHLRRDFPQVRTLAWFEHEQWSEDKLRRIAAQSRY